MRKRTIRNYRDLQPLVEELGFLPLLPGIIPTFSLWDYTDNSTWFQQGDPNDPWEWRCRAAGEGNLAYGKFFNGKAGFISKEWFPLFAHCRRKGRDFETLFVEERLPVECGQIMALFHGSEEYPSFELKQLTGIIKQFESRIAELQHLTFLVTCCFFRKRTKDAKEYGWPVGVFCRAESLFEENHIRSRFSEPYEGSRDQLISHCAKLFPKVPKKKIVQFIDK
ncbi:MAG: hypothetical protein Q4C95_12730 [Planctomycetia bacterium]|nr:hypothetical protein [Planctomycetia bacterium]